MNSFDQFELLQRYLDGALPPRECQALEARLLADRALASELVRMAREEAIFRDWSAANLLANPSEMAGQRAGTKARGRRVSVAWIAAVAVLLLLGFVGVLLNRTPTDAPDRSVAVLEEVLGDVEVVSLDGQVAAAATGQRLFAGQEVKTGEEGSSTVLRWNDHTKLLLSAETHIRLPSDGQRVKTNSGAPKVFVSEGIVAADIPRRPDDKPLIILSDHAEMRSAHGRVSFVSLPEATFVETDTGLAKLIRKSDGTMIDVPTGFFAVANQNRTPFKSNKAPQRQSKPRHSMMDNTGPVVGLFFDPEGTSITGAAGDAIKRWDFNTGKLVWTLRPQKKKSVRLYSPGQDGKLLAVAVEDRTVRVYDANSGEERIAFRGNKRVTATALSPDSRVLAVAWHAPREGTEVRLYDTTFAAERLLLTGQTGPIQAIAFSPSGSLLATASLDRSVQTWDVKHLSLVRSLSKMPQDARALAFSPDDKLLAIGERRGQIRVVDTATGSERLVLTGHLRDIYSVQFAPDGQRIVSGSADGTARMWQVSDGRELGAFKGHKNAVNSVAFSQDGRIVATGGADRAVLLWDVQTLERRP